MRTKKYISRLGALLIVALAVVTLSLKYSGSLVGQLTPEAPVILTPENGEALQLDSTRVSWSGGPVPSIHVSWTMSPMGGSTSVLSISELATGRLIRQISLSFSSLPDRTHPSYELSVAGFIPYTEYAITVSTIGGAISVPASLPKIFWVAIKDMPSFELLKPNVLAPLGQVTSANAVALWTPLNGDPRTRNYKIELTSEESADAFSVTTRSLADKNAPSLSFVQKITLKKNIEYKYRVMGEDMYRKKSQWSDYGRFMVNDDAFAAQKPTLLAPLGEVLYFNTNNKFTFSEISGAKNYRVEVRGSNNQESYSQTVETRLLADKTAPFAEFRNFPNRHGSTYVWYVQAFSQNDTPSQISDMQSFTVIVDPFGNKKAVATGPTGTVPKAPMKFMFNKVAYAVGYILSINVGDKNYIHRFYVDDIGDADQYALTVPNLPIEYDTEYSFKVLAFDKTNVNTQYSDVIRFKTVANEFLNVLPETLSPRGQVTSFDGILKWKPVSGPVKDYRVSILSHDGSKAIFSYDKYISIFDLKDPVNPSFTVGPLEPNTYSFTVQARNIEEYHSRLSEPSTFTILSSSLPTAPLTTPVVTGPLSGSPEWSEVTWNAVPNASSYMLFVKDLTTGKEVTIVNRPVLLSELPDRNAPSVRLGNKLQYAGLYRIWVRAVRDPVTGTRKTYSPWSAALTYVAGIGFPGENINGALLSVKPVITGPVSPAFPSPNITWQQVPGAGSYEVFIQNNSTGRIEKVLVTDNTSMYYQPEYSYTAGGIYTVWIRAIGGGVLSAWSLPWVFTVGM